MNLRKILGHLTAITGILGIIYFLPNKIIFDLNYFIEEFMNSFIILLIMFILAKIIGGSEHSIFYTLFGIFKPEICIEGKVDKKFEEIKNQIKKIMQSGNEQGIQLVVYEKGQKVVDLVGISDTYSYDFNTLQCVFDISQMINQIVVALMVQQGYIKYDDKISKYWKEFGSNGKQDITLQQLISHEAGLRILNKQITDKNITTKGIRENQVGRIIEITIPSSKDLGKQVYHHTSQGLILNEIVRRIDPKRRTIGEFLNQEINPNLMRLGEFPSQNAHSNAQGLADLAQIMSLKGKSGNFGIFEKNFYENINQEIESTSLQKNFVNNRQYKLVKGGWNKYKIQYGNNKDSVNFYGQIGFGGSLVCWNSELQIGFAFVKNYISVDQSAQSAFSILQQCLQIIQKENITHKKQI
ncbi:Beta-lactamase/transpeptidase-like protein [Pseudocohnilembus persalinus]|uniref:Beta-lactamase/transpeptidase-like protein n=1 Tax=Pseudocohnilembus persalinus TaxID=266149 RepID=A0A0V0R6K2_PSEPJ|nr:Beta-lactamase/transpeptidase-like protein [Pseudocohnilembus persalinus]|eukprot:KRX09978.1 Beta-lactamase/transpeptidase-like protein [Pseudocohnilembus persalinus]